MYKLIKDTLTGNINSVVRLPDNAFIPFDPQNVDYQTYLKWVAEGHQPEPAEEQ